ncbi:MAG: glycosyltransferase, partial [Planctomycetota bacterium]
MDVSLIVPTFREVENLPHLAAAIHSSLSARGLSHEIIIVDDNSRDGTEDACGKLASQFPLRLITRRDERGLSSAVVRGMNEATGKTLVVMDADLSH